MSFTDAHLSERRIQPKILNCRLATEDRIEGSLAFVNRRWLQLSLEKSSGDLSEICCHLRSRRGLDERPPQIDRVDRRAIVTLNESNYPLTQKLFYLLLVQFDVLAPAVDDDANLLSWIAKSIKNFQRPARAANRMNLEREHDQDPISMVQG